MNSMALHDPPYYRYLLFEEWDKKAFRLIKKIARKKEYPRILGTPEEKNQFLKMLIRTQKSTYGWRKFLNDILKQIEKSCVIDTKALIIQYPLESVSNGTPAWVTYEEDKIVSNFIDELATRKVKFLGNDQEIAEFVLRFILGQLGHDWEQTIMLIWEILGDKDVIYLKDINKELKNFDYLKLFE